MKKSKTIKAQKPKTTIQARKYNAPLKLDMPFQEAIQRLVRVQPIKAKKK